MLPQPPPRAVSVCLNRRAKYLRGRGRSFQIPHGVRPREQRLAVVRTNDAGGANNTSSTIALLPSNSAGAPTNAASAWHMLARPFKSFSKNDLSRSSGTGIRNRLEIGSESARSADQRSCRRLADQR